MRREKSWRKMKKRMRHESSVQTERGIEESVGDTGAGEVESAREGGRRWLSGCGDEVGWRLEGRRGVRDEGKLVSRMAMAMAESMS